jgi:hypothetical protein
MPEALKSSSLGLAVAFFSWAVSKALPIPLGLENWFSFLAPLGGIGGYGIAVMTRVSARHWGVGKTILISVAIVVAGVVFGAVYTKMCNASPPDPSFAYTLGQEVLLALTFCTFGYVIGTARFKFAGESDRKPS